MKEYLKAFNLSLFLFLGSALFLFFKNGIGDFLKIIASWINIPFLISYSLSLPINNDGIFGIFLMFIFSAVFSVLVAFISVQLVQRKIIVKLTSPAYYVLGLFAIIEIGSIVYFQK